MNHDPQILALRGAGVITDACAGIHEFAQSLTPPCDHSALQRAQILDPASITAHDLLPQLALQALHQALTMADPPADPARLGLLVVTAWGMIDATASYLDSMLDAQGRYASPRHFTRSVYSTAASILAIHFHIHGPCETLAFALPENPITGALAQAWRLLAAKRCDHVAVIWAEQAGPLAQDLARRASQDLHHPEYDRYVAHPLGHGATSLLIASSQAAGALTHFPIQASIPSPPIAPALRGNPFPMDAALPLLASLLQRL